MHGWVASSIITSRTKGQRMGTKDKASNKIQDVKGRVKETVGSTTGNRDLEAKGKTDQAKSSVKDVGEHVKDAATDIKDASQNR